MGIVESYLVANGFDDIEGSAMNSSRVMVPELSCANQSAQVTRCLPREAVPWVQRTLSSFINRFCSRSTSSRSTVRRTLSQSHSSSHSARAKMKLWRTIRVIYDVLQELAVRAGGPPGVEQRSIVCVCQDCGGGKVEGKVRGCPIDPLKGFSGRDKSRVAMPLRCRRKVVQS